ncbi:hypothetical protein B0H14DRAFT_2564018 [Mycena olivaceomarginata]|nr:hypothetical protein B0H14DRAFT_2564018 [Mycena olivaceomarginata]
MVIGIKESRLLEEPGLHVYGVMPLSYRVLGYCNKNPSGKVARNPATNGCIPTHHPAALCDLLSARINLQLAKASPQVFVTSSDLLSVRINPQPMDTCPPATPQFFVPSSNLLSPSAEHKNQPATDGHIPACHPAARKCICPSSDLLGTRITPDIRKLNCEWIAPQGMLLTAAKRISVNRVQNMWQYLHQKNANMKTGQDSLTDDFWIFPPECPTLPAKEVQVFSALDVMDTSPLHKLQALFSQAAIVAVASHHTMPQLVRHNGEACVEKPNKSDRDTYTGQDYEEPVTKDGIQPKKNLSFANAEQQLERLTDDLCIIRCLYSDLDAVLREPGVGLDVTVRAAEIYSYLVDNMRSVEPPAHCSNLVPKAE